MFLKQSYHMAFHVDYLFIFGGYNKCCSFDERVLCSFSAPQKKVWICIKRLEKHF